MNRIILISGGFDPIHGGHVKYIREAKKVDPPSPLCVALNSDEWLVRKKGKYFMNFDERKEVVSGMKDVDLVIPFIDDDDFQPHLNYTYGDNQGWRKSAQDEGYAVGELLILNSQSLMPQVSLMSHALSLIHISEPTRPY